MNPLDATNRPKNLPESRECPCVCPCICYCGGQGRAEERSYNCGHESEWRIEQNWMPY
jgi:hypothetical protein